MYIHTHIHNMYCSLYWHGRHQHWEHFEWVSRILPAWIGCQNTTPPSPPPAKCPLLWLHVRIFYSHIQWPNDVSPINLKCLSLCKQEIGGGWWIWQAKLAGYWIYPVYIYIFNIYSMYPKYILDIFNIYWIYIEYIQYPSQATTGLWAVTHLNSRDNWRKVTWRLHNEENVVFSVTLNTQPSIRLTLQTRNRSGVMNMSGLIGWILNISSISSIYSIYRKYILDIFNIYPIYQISFTLSKARLCSLSLYIVKDFLSCS